MACYRIIPVCHIRVACFRTHNACTHPATKLQVGYILLQDFLVFLLIRMRQVQIAAQNRHVNSVEHFIQVLCQPRRCRSRIHVCR